MRITVHQTGSDADLGEQHCCICRQRFHLGPVSCLAFNGPAPEVLWGEVCSACVQGGPDYIQRWLDSFAWSARMSAAQKTEAAEEGISDCPTLEEVLVAEAFYERPMFRTPEEYDAAISRGEIL